MDDLIQEIEKAIEKAAEEITSIRNHIYILTEQISATKQHHQEFETIKSRLWELQKELRSPNFYKTECQK